MLHAELRMALDATSRADCGSEDSDIMFFLDQSEHTKKTPSLFPLERQGRQTTAFANKLGAGFCSAADCASLLSQT